MNADEERKVSDGLTSRLPGVFNYPSITQNAHGMPKLHIALVCGCIAASTPAFAACPELPPRVANATLDDFLSAPEQLLDNHRTDGVIRSLVGTLLLIDAERTLSALMKIIPLTSSSQKAEIVRAMASVIENCTDSQPRSALMIRDTLHGLTDNGTFAVFGDAVQTNDNVQPAAADPTRTLQPTAVAKDGPFGAATTDPSHRFKVSNGKLWNPFAPMRIPAPLEGVRKLR